MTYPLDVILMNVKNGVSETKTCLSHGITNVYRPQ